MLDLEALGFEGVRRTELSASESSQDFNFEAVQPTPVAEGDELAGDRQKQRQDISLIAGKISGTTQGPLRWDSLARQLATQPAPSSDDGTAQIAGR